MRNVGGVVGSGLIAVLVALAACSPAAAPPAPTTAPAPTQAPAQPPTAASAPKAAPPAAASPASSPIAAQPATGRELKIPAIVALTGPLAGFGVPSKNGLDLAADEINQAGGIGGMKLVYQYLDPGTDPAAGTTLARSVADWALIIIGPNLTLHAQAAAPVINQLGIPAFVTNSIPEIVSKNRPNIFGVLSSVKDLTISGVQKWAQKVPTLKKVVIIKDARDPGASTQADALVEGFKLANVEVLDTITFSLGDVDFTAQVTKAKSRNPDGIAIAALSSEGAGVAREIRQQGLTVPLFFTQSGWTPDTIKLGGPAVDGAYASITWSADARSATVKAAYEARFKEPLSQTPVIYYDVVHIIKDVFEKQKLTGDPAKLKEERVKLSEGLNALKDWEGAGLAWSYDHGDGIPYRTAILVQAKGGTESVVN